MEPDTRSCHVEAGVRQEMRKVDTSGLTGKLHHAEEDGRGRIVVEPANPIRPERA